jgi:hypothetical protein
MNTFNKYQFLADLQSELLDAVATNQIESEDQVWDSLTNLLIMLSSTMLTALLSLLR